MFWEDVVKDRKRGNVIRPMPAIPDNGWQRPTEFPDLSRARALSFDTETYDPELLTKGPGWARDSGHIVGISVGTDDGHRWYFPMRHEIEPENNCDPEMTLRWASDQLGRAHQPKVGANLLYDVGWLRQEGVIVRGALADVQFAEALLEEKAKTALDDLGVKYLGEHKETSVLYRWLADFYGGQPNGKQRANIYRSPARLAGPYAESDADLPMRIMPLQARILQAEGLLDLFRMECELIPLLIDMRFAGVRVDLTEAERVRDELVVRAGNLQQELKEASGVNVNVNSADDIAKVFNKYGLHYNKTPKGRPSFTKDFLKEVDHPIAGLIGEIRKVEKIRSTFIESYILNSHVGGRVFCQFHPLRGDDGGTRSGRFASSTPNLQNVPSRDKVLAPLVRGIFIPDEGHKQWRRYDYSQIEYRFLIHYAVGAMAESVRRHFNENPDTDYHEYAHGLIHDLTGLDLDRKPVKTINFGLIYGMGVNKLIKSLGLSEEMGQHLYESYHKALPFAGETMQAAMNEAEQRGFIATVLGRRSRFDLFGPRFWKGKGRPMPLPLEDAVKAYGKVQREHLHKALNRRLQGSAADLMKYSMLRCYRDGIFDATGIPRLTVHDELNFSDPGGRDEAFLEMRHVLETAIPLSIPVRADYEAGPDWGHCVAIKA